MRDFWLKILLVLVLITFGIVQVKADEMETNEEVSTESNEIEKESKTLEDIEPNIDQENIKAKASDISEPFEEEKNILPEQTEKLDESTKESDDNIQVSNTSDETTDIYDSEYPQEEDEEEPEDDPREELETDGIFLSMGAVKDIRYYSDEEIENPNTSDNIETYLYICASSFILIISTIIYRRINTKSYN